METRTHDEQRNAVRERYARIAEEASRDTVEGGCGCGCGCGTGLAPDEVGRAIGYDDEALAAGAEGSNLGLGCGNPVGLASLSEGETVVDLGSGAGFDCFLAAERVGRKGRVIGVDMTPEMIDRARANARRDGRDNVEFRLGEIEALPVENGVADLVMSNCVLNLSPDKSRVLREAWRVLKPGGRLVISDLVSDEPVPAELAGDLDAVAGCLPVERDAYLDAIRAAGFADPRIHEEKPYPSLALLEADGVKAHLERHPEHRERLERFASTMAGALFLAEKPRA